MKLKCEDGKVRLFEITGYDSAMNTWSEARCCHCTVTFGYHDTEILKPKFKAHKCVEMLWSFKERNKR